MTLSDVQRAGRGEPVRIAGAGASSVPTRHGSIRLKTWEPSGSHGASTTVVLIHGLFADLEAWAATALHLSRAGRRVVALDLPAHGESDAAVADFASLVESVGDAVDAATEGPVVLVGHSFGAAVTAHLLARPGLPVQAAVLLAPLGLGTEIEQRFVDGVLNGGTSEALGRELAKLSTSGAVPSAAYLEQLRARIAARRVTLAAVCDDVAVNGVQQLFIRGQLDAAACPVSIVHGRADEIIPWQHALNAPPKVALHLAPHVGHMPQWDATALTTEVIIRASATR
ncbi:MAG: alpha/beta fold hydrolase [Burkholderiaceae bacterium]|nr:alpha/beta fold hydrolase [Burkholderiaceae bacterium]